MKPIKRLDRSKGIVGKPVKVSKDKDNWEASQEAEEEQDKDEDSPLLNFSSRPKDPPRTTYDDKGDVVQNKILGRE